jgi:mRNA interferase MazF
LTRSAILSRLVNVTVAPLTRTVRGIRSEVELTPAQDAVPARCVVSLDGIITIPQADLRNRMMSLRVSRMTEVFDAIRFAFDMR